MNNILVLKLHKPVWVIYEGNLTLRSVLKYFVKYFCHNMSSQIFCNVSTKIVQKPPTIRINTTTIIY